MFRRDFVPFMAVLAITLTACSQPPRYVFLSQNVAAAGASGSNEFSSPETATTAGAVFRLDTKTGEMVKVLDQIELNERGEPGVLSMRVFTPEETNAVARRLKAQSGR